MVNPSVIEYHTDKDKTGQQWGKVIEQHTDKGSQQWDKGLDMNKIDHRTTKEEHQIKCNDVTSSHDENVGEDACTVIVSFSLPAGSFATALLRELTHNDDFI